MSYLTDDFKPPIKTRTTQELLEIAGAPKKWNERALMLAMDELYNRNVDTTQIEKAKNIEKLQVEFEAFKKAEEGFNFYNFPLFLTRHFINWGEVFIFIFSWELEKDGFFRKANQQRKYRPITLLMILAAIVYSYF